MPYAVEGFVVEFVGRYGHRTRSRFVSIPVPNREEALATLRRLESECVEADLAVKARQPVPRVRRVRALSWVRL